MYIKFIGAAFLIVAGCMSGKEISSNYLNRLRQLEEIKKTIIFICGEIKYNNSNLDYVFTKISKNSKGFIKEFLESVVKDLNGNTEREITDVWCENVEKEIKTKTSLEASDLNDLKDMGNLLGITDKDTQISNLNLYLEKIQLQIDKLEKEKDEKCRLYKTVATMFGLLIVITII